MEFFRKLERRYGRYAIHNLMNYIVAMYVVGMILQYVNPMLYWQWLCLNPEAILHGQIWRIVTFMVWPPFGGLVSNALMIYLYYSLGSTLERVWGAFRFNVYFFLGILGHVAASLLLYFLGTRVILTTTYLNMSLFLAFAATFPDLQFYIWFVIPIKAKWLALIDSLVIIQGLLFGGTSSRVEIIFSLLNFILFFIITRNYSRVNPKEIRRKQEFKSQVKIKPQGRTHHRCAVCGRTELDGDDLEFRYCSKCEGNYEYCQDHLYTHKHVTKDSQ
ncbi:MAG TPA: hypothetical protein IAA04_00755 [Candidatus Lachnoclostridium pullistercoris]|uniref:Rhomboid family intramembrane serine protease n=1 Tax=Candidatus Lachnoclostridium pullistercoris TaxID=2838632 RepID=A0A9D2PAT5_9FIRM|nr:hypothetical protein [Candidatus Lachnoclostridium pullistercoris]